MQDSERRARSSTSRRLALVAPALVGVLFATPASGSGVLAPPAVPVVVHLDRPGPPMAAGLGFSWHAIARPFELTGLLGLESRNARGSAWGGNPPPASASAWRQLEDHAAWLGPDWVRVEISQRMYEPSRGEYDWDNEEMRALYRILDWCQGNDVAVLLTQMWSFVEWNAYPGIPPLQSAPRSLEAFAEGLGTLVEELTVARGYRAIRWLAIVNEPNARWHLGPDGERQPIGPALAAVRRELDRRGLDVGLAGPGWSDLRDRDELFDPASASLLGAFTAHSWGRPDPAGMKRWVERARGWGLPFLLSEIGDLRFGWKNESPGPAGWAANLSNVEKTLLAIAQGVDGLSRWSFTNRGDLDGQFQLVRTWDRERREYLAEVAPEPVPYFLWGLLTRLTARGSAPLAVEAPESAVVAAAVETPGGAQTLFLLNRDRAPAPVRVRFEGRETGLAWFRYEATESAVAAPGFRLAPTPLRGRASGSPLEEVLPPASLTALSTLALAPEAPGVIVDRPRPASP